MAVCLLVVSGCSENNDGLRSSKRMSFSTGRFNQGFKDGVRDAKWSLTDTHAAWLWQWMMEQEYVAGYEQGWNAGRREVKLERQAKEQTDRQ